MANNELDQSSTNAKLTADCARAFEQYSKDPTSPQLFLAAAEACGKPGAKLPDSFPHGNDLLPAANEKPIDKAKVQTLLNSVDHALSLTFFGASTPDTAAITKSLTNSTSAERQAMQQSYLDAKHKPLMQSMAEKYGSASEDYHQLKGLLLRSDSPASMAAVQLHMQLFKIDEQTRQIDKNNKGTSTGFWNNAIDNDSFSAGTAGTIDALGSLAGSLARGSSNKELAKAISSLKPADIPELKSEHMRIYRRDLADMLENTHGISAQAVTSFQKMGIR